MKQTTWCSEVASPLGPLKLAATVHGLCGVYFVGQSWFPEDRHHWVRDDARFAGVTRWLKRYFTGVREAFEEPLAPVGTSFQLQVWSALREISWGSAWTYQQVAASMGRPTAARAVGAAIGRNPISLIVPCHRVVGSNGQLTGYAGGLERKARLLQLEGWRGGAQPPGARID